MSTKSHVLLPSIRLLSVVALLLYAFTACTYKDRVAPIALPETSSNMVVVGEGLMMVYATGSP